MCWQRSVTKVVLSVSKLRGLIPQCFLHHNFCDSNGNWLWKSRWNGGLAVLEIEAGG